MSDTFLRTRRRYDRLAYYLRNIARDVCPPVFFRRRLAAILEGASESDREHLPERVHYYNKLSAGAAVGEAAPQASRISMAHSRYYYDLKEHARYFPGGLRLHYLFGDVRDVPEKPTIVKSRPIGGDNRNSVLLNLDKLRHFHLPPDRIAFSDKKPRAVWRGARNNPRRLALVRRYREHPLCDIGFAGGPAAEVLSAPYLPAREQMRFRYIVSVEGNDVATNLKWILASNSLCLMTRPVFETWFLEGRLEAGKHYAELDPEFGDLEEKILHYERHPDEAREIVRNANAHVRRFLDPGREQLVSLAVLYKYFVATGQLAPEGWMGELVSGK